jgi:ATP-dependent DNA helicase DinG
MGEADGTGDRAELTFCRMIPICGQGWMRGGIRARGKVPSFNPCFVTECTNGEGRGPDHREPPLFFADLALKQDDFGSILPEYSAVVFDEAHEMEDVASDYFGRQISNFRFDELARDADQTLRLLHLGTPSLLRRTQRIRERSRAFFETFPARDGKFPFSRNEREAFLEQNREAYDALATALKGFETECAALTQKPEEILRIARRSFELRQELAFLFDSNERNFVYWYERRNKGVFLAATPIDVSQILREKLFEQFDTVILTSATLTVAGRFEFIRHRLGLDHAKERGLPPEFDYKEQAMLDLPPAMPDVRNPAYTSKAADEIVNLLETSQGRAFCLFTSYSQMNELFERVRARVPFPLLLQGTSPRSVLLERFKNTPGAVLFATASFWQGVDVPGRAASPAWIVDRPRLRCRGPDSSRRECSSRRRAQSVRGISAPQAVLALKAEVWRLIRYEDGSRSFGVAG